MRSLLLCLLLVSFAGCNREGIKIAIVTPISHPSLEAIERGFKEKFAKECSSPVTFKTYNAHGSQSLMRNEIEALSRHNFDLVLTIGTIATQMAVEKHLTMPLVFTAVNHPPQPGKNRTGIIEELDFASEIQALLDLKPTIQTLLLVYNPLLPGLEKDKKQVEDLLAKKGIHLLAVEIFQVNEIKRKASCFFEKADAVMVLKDNTVVSGLEVLVQLCEKYQIPLSASDLDSPERGAALGYGVRESQFGEEAAIQAALILNYSISPESIPYTPIKEFSLVINREAFLRQGGKNG